MQTSVVCLTPTRDEGSNIRRFLASASLWADRIIVCDQGSTDETVEIAKTFPKAFVFENTNTDYDEGFRQRLLISKARELNSSSKLVMIALDADEILSSNFVDSQEYQTIRNSSPGTSFQFDWAQLLPGCRQFWRQPIPPIGVVDDGSDHEGRFLHSTRVPIGNGPLIKCSSTVILHYHYTDWEKMRSKVRWYLAQEHLRESPLSPIDLFHKYHAYLRYRGQAESVPSAWFSSYQKLGVDVTTVVHDRNLWWDSDVCSLLRTHGSHTFRKLPIWDKDWCRFSGGDISLRDPRTRIEKKVHRWLTDSTVRPVKSVAPTRYVESVLRRFGW